ncbi:uncharacterized protein LOC131851938 [Achroia grisella]|uniref:uncharacterized protein LOC131851938 n=1 Tax=Achroia grisella TaxID=688607 RepID=UPI0027D24B73|nr:uncharacterized protein LOC131851938 [Achroia grisella]
MMNDNVAGISYPYPYRGSREERFDVKPYYGKAYSEIIVPKVAATTAVGVSKLGLVATVATFAFGLVKKVASFLIFKSPALLVGVLVTFGICKLTPLCSKLSGVNSLIEVQREIRSLATPERLAIASDFVENAIRKYRSLQDSY